MNKKTKKLLLGKEVVRQLSAESLAGVEGALQMVQRTQNLTLCTVGSASGGTVIGGGCITISALPTPTSSAGNPGGGGSF
jgi:hypothetical protein